MIRKILLSNLLILYVSLSAYSQNKTVYKFEKLTIENGLSSNTIDEVVQDKKGFIWIGTDNGLNRFDGYDVIQYKTDKNNSNSISSNVVKIFFIDSKSNLWIGTNFGMNLYNYDNNNFTRSFLDTTGNPIVKNISTINEDKDGKLWMGTTWDGLYIYDYQNDTIINYHDKKDTSSGLTTHYITHIFRDNQDNMWVATRHGLFLYDYLSEKFTAFHPEPGNKNSLLEDYITCMEHDLLGRIWIGTRKKGVCIFNTKSKTFSKLNIEIPELHNALNSGVRVIKHTSDGKIWVFARKGVYIYDEQKKSFHQPIFFSNTEVIKPNRDFVKFVLEDINHNYWFATPEDGVCFIDKQKQSFFHYSKSQGLSDKVVSSIVEDSKGVFWIGTRYGSLNFFNRQKNELGQVSLCIDGPKDDIVHIIDLHINSKDNLWLGTNRGLFSYNTNNENCINYNHIFTGNTESLYITTIMEDNNGMLWMGVLRGGIFISKPNKNMLLKIENIKENLGKKFPMRISSIHEIDNKVYIGSRLGLYIFNLSGVLLKHYEEFDQIGLRDNFIHYIHKDSNDRIWLCTNFGLTYFDDKNEKFLTYTVEDGLPDNKIYGLLEDNEGQFWLSSSNGLFCLTLEEPIDSTSLTQSIEVYNQDDGLQSMQFKPASICRSSSGEFLFGGINGFNIFYPSEIRINDYIPPIVLTNFKVNNQVVPIAHSDTEYDIYLEKSIFETDEITLKHYHKTFSFHYVALNYSSSKNNQYAYKLIGYDKDWNYVGNQRFAHYTNINPGKYVFVVKGSNNNEKWNNEGVSIKINILPPIWKTWWAYSTYSLLIMFIIYFAIRYIINISKLREDNLKFRLFTNISHDIKTPLTLLQTPVDAMLESGKFDLGLLKTMKRNIHRLSTLITQLLDFRKMEIGTMHLSISNGNISEFIQKTANSFHPMAYQKSIKYTINNFEPYINAWFDSDKIEKITFNLLSNAFKYTENDGSIDLVVKTFFKKEVKNIGTKTSHDSQWIEIKVIDTGVGIPEDQLPKIFDRFYRILNTGSARKEGSGIGLAHTKDLVKIHKGEIMVQSIEGKGSTFTVSIPIAKDYFKESEIYDSDIVQPQKENLEDINLEPYDNKTEKDSLSPALKSSHKLLVIDDNPDIRYILKNQFKNFYRVLEATDGKEGMDVALKELPDLIICDIMMPRISGLEFCSQIKKHETTNNIPVILLTALGSAEQKMIGLETGADDYISKPFNINEVVIRVKNLINRQSNLKEQFRKSFIQNPKEVNELTADEKWLQKIIEIVENNIANSHLSGEFLVDSSNTSKSQLYKRLRAITGQSVNEFIRIIRLKKAAQMIEKKVDNISQIAYDVGFTDPAYFTRCFKEYFNKSPSEYKK